MSKRRDRTFTAPWMAGICEKCPHRGNCKEPCAPVAQYVDGPGQQVYEAGTEVLPEDGHQRATAKSDGREEYGGDTINVNWGWSDDDDLTTTLSKIHAKVFCLKFFEGWSSADIAVSLHTSRPLVSTHYNHACKRLLDALEILDRGKSLQLKAKMLGGDNLPAGLRVYLARAVFGLPYNDLVEIFGGRSGDALKAQAFRAIKQFNNQEVQLAPGVWLRVEK